MKIFVVVHVQAQTWVSFVGGLIGAMAGRSSWALVEEAVKTNLARALEDSNLGTAYPRLEEVWVSYWSDDHFSLGNPPLRIKRKGKEIELGSVTFDNRMVKKLSGTRDQASFLTGCALLQVVSGARKAGDVNLANALEAAHELSKVRKLFSVVDQKPH